MVSVVEYIGRRFGQGNAERPACNEVSISELIGRRHSDLYGTVRPSNCQSAPHETVDECYACLPSETDEMPLLQPSAAAKELSTTS